MPSLNIAMGAGRQEKKSIVWCRCFCCIMIFFLHYLKRLDLEDYNWYLQPAVPAFLLVSAYLYGVGRDSRKFGLSFLKKRWISLSQIFYPFLVAVALIDIVFGNYDPVDILKRLASGVFYLTNFGYYLPGCGHVWFLERIVECYVLLVVVSKFPNFINKLSENLMANVCLIFAVLCLGFFYRGLGPVHYLFYLLTFVHAKKIEQLVKKIITIPLFLIVLLGYCGIYVNYKGNFHYGIYLWYFNVCILGFALVLICLKWLENVTPPKIVRWLSSLSFEIYLVHHLFIYDYPLYVSASITVALAFLLHIISEKLFRQKV